MIMRKAIIHIVPAIGHSALFVIGLALAPLPALASRPSGAVGSSPAVASTAVSATVPVASPAENITQKDSEDLGRRLFHHGHW